MAAVLNAARDDESCADCGVWQGIVKLRIGKRGEASTTMPRGRAGFLDFVAAELTLPDDCKRGSGEPRAAIQNKFCS
jgi:hypothetical protein